MKLCCIGSGSITRMHANALREGGHTLWSVVGRRTEQTEQFARETGFARHGIDVDAALDDPAIEAVVIGSPSGMHFEHATKAIQRKLPTLIEIPVALGLSDALQLDRQARQSGVPVMAAHTRRFQPALRNMHDLVSRGMQIHHAIQRYGFLRRQNVNWVGYQRSWTDNLIWHHGGHATDALLWVLGREPTEISVHAGPPHAELGITMDIEIGLTFPDGVIGGISLSYNTHQPLDDALFVGEHDTIAADYRNGQLSGKDGMLFDAKTSDAVATNVIAAQDVEFTSAIAEGRPPWPGIADVLPSLRVLQVVQDAFDRAYSARS